MRLSLWLMVAVGLAAGGVVLAMRISSAGGRAGVLSQVDTLVLADECSGCEITLERIATLGGPDLPFEFGNSASLAVMSDGRYVTTDFGGSEIAVFGADGRLERVVGRPGQGPGEFEDIKEVAVAQGDTVYVLSVGGLITRLGPDLRYLDRIILRVPASPQGWTLMPSGEVAVVSVPLGTAAPPDRVSLLRSDGTPRTSFARAPRSYGLEDYNETVGVLAPSPSRGGLWYAKLNEYTLHLFVDERLETVVTRHADWFEPWEGPDRGIPGVTEPRRPTVAHLAERENGLLTVIALVADANWEENRPEIDRVNTGGEIRSGTLPFRMMMDAVVEVIDPGSGQIVGTVRSDDPLRAPVGGDGTLLYTAREDDIGRYRLIVYRTEFARGG